MGKLPPLPPLPVMSEGDTLGEGIPVVRRAVEAAIDSVAVINHERDEECTLDEDRWCTECGVLHAETPCASCGGYAFHKPDCATPDEGSDE